MGIGVMRSGWQKGRDVKQKFVLYSTRSNAVAEGSSLLDSILSSK